MPRDVRAFAARYVAAFNSGREERVLSLDVPEARACITQANREVYDTILSSEMRDKIAPGYRVSLLSVNENNLKALASLAWFPVKPERELHIDYRYPNTSDGGQVVLWLVRRDGRWMSDSPCMTAEAIQEYRDNAAAREHYKTLAAKIREPLRSQLMAMLRANQMGEAEQRYQQAAGGDMRNAMLVINALRDQMR